MVSSCERHGVRSSTTTDHELPWTFNISVLLSSDQAQI